MTETLRDFDAVTQLDETAPGIFAIDLSDAWGVPGVNVNGGYAMSVCVRALRQVLAHPDPLSVSMYYERPVLAGPTEIRTEVGRSGRRMSFGSATLLQQGKELARVVATYTDFQTSSGATRMSGAAPALPPPEQCIDPFEGQHSHRTGLMGRLDYRYPARLGWMNGAPSGVAEGSFWMRFADGREPDTLALPGMVDMALPGVFDLGAITCPTVELTVHLRGRPAPGWLACRVSTRYVLNGMHEEDFEIWDCTGALVAQSRQLALFVDAMP